jgi:hypothetical protein
MHETLCDLLLDLVQNSIEAEAAEIVLSFSEDEERIRMELSDNGRGMSAEELDRARDPFYTDGTKHRRRRVGLGLPFFLQLVEQVEGRGDIVSEKGRGTRLFFDLPRNHVDLPPVGSIPAFLLPALTWKGEYELLFIRSKSVEGELSSYEVRRSELTEALGEIESAESLVLLRSYLISQEDAIN